MLTGMQITRLKMFHLEMITPLAFEIERSCVLCSDRKFIFILSMTYTFQETKKIIGYGSIFLTDEISNSLVFRLWHGGLLDTFSWIQS